MEHLLDAVFHFQNTLPKTTSQKLSSYPHQGFIANLQVICNPTGKTGFADQRSHIVLKNTKTSYSTKKFAVV
jgi:hypothetical protein